MDDLSPRIGAYLRVSTLEQSTELQKREIEAYITARRWQSVVFYEDKATGTNANRPALKQLLLDAHQRKLDMVICWKLDRLFRSLKDLVNTLSEFSHLGITFISLKDTIDMSSSSGRLMVHLLAAFSEFEAALIQERVRAGLRNAKAKGKRLGRPKKRDDQQILALRQKGLSLRQISRELGISMGSVQKGLAAFNTLTKLEEKSE